MESIDYLAKFDSYFVESIDQLVGSIMVIIDLLVYLDHSMVEKRMGFTIMAFGLFNLDILELSFKMDSYSLLHYGKD